MVRYIRMAAAALPLAVLLGTPAAGADQQQVKRAVERGAAFLRSAQGPDGAWFTYSKVGATALAGLTLLECDVPENDPDVRKAAARLHRPGGYPYHLFPFP